MFVDSSLHDTDVANPTSHSTQYLQATIIMNEWMNEWEKEKEKF